MAFRVKKIDSTATCVVCSEKITQGQPAWQAWFKKQKKFAHIICHENKKAAEEKKGPLGKQSIEDLAKYQVAMSEMNAKM